MFERRYTIFAPPFSLLSLLYYIYIQKRNTLSRTFFTFCPAPLFTFIYLYYIYSIYRDEYTFPQLLPLSHTFIILLLYIEEGTFYPPPFSPYIYSYKVNTFSTAHFLTLIVWEKVCGEKFLKTLLV